MTDTEDRIEGKVAQILTEQDLVINRGSLQGVRIGMRFAILSPRGADIKDPDTGEILDSVELAKTFVKIVDVKPKVAVGRTFRTIKSRGTSISALGFAFGTGEDRQETLRTSERRLQQDLSPSDSYVKIGDPAVQVIGDSFAGLEWDPS
ncbi:hypothetical protein B7R21_11675 [Subtercola boreus]|uniref:Uncharacterized protein n=1 Tax=Subtercola boreus TaxID=120213 RepID=A0A3E0VQ20_9MICO|nr:hypothetical protein [Subtercola boreus]RFA11986.1 hypothetical protein B7R21_11675 [Subtercola boreus]